MLDAPDPPRGPGRYHVSGGRRTWYGSSSEEGAWAELARHLPDGVDATQVRRRLGRATFSATPLDLTDADVLRRLGLKPADLTRDDLAVTQALAELAAEAGFEAVLAPSAALAGQTTLAVFGATIDAGRVVEDRGVVSPPGPSRRRRR